MKLVYITLRGEQHPLCYNLTAVEEICEEFGSLDGMTEAINSGEQGVQVLALGKVLRCLLDGGRAYCKEMEMDLPRPVRNPSALIDITSPETVKAIFASVNAGKEAEVEAYSKNVEATPGE